MATTNIYVLQLEGGRYYIGKSDNVMIRYQQHLDPCGFLNERLKIRTII